MTAPTKSLALGALLTASVIVSCGPGGHDELLQESLPAIKASTATAQVAEIPVSVEVRGTVEAERSAAITSRVTAMVSRVHIKAGDRVGRGQPLIQIDPTTANGQVSQATGALAQARAALALAERNYQRFQTLKEKNAASELELDMARMQFEQAQGAVEQAEGAVAAASSVAEESIVRAPFAGLVVRRMVEVGDLAAPGRPLLMLDSERGRRLSLAVPASLTAQSDLAVGTILGVTIDGREDLGTIQGKIVERSPAADPMSHSFEVKVELPESATDADPIASGTTGRARIPTGRRDAISIPNDAVHRQGGLTFVVTLDDDNRTESRIVTLGRELTSDSVEVLSGLSGDETVLVGLRSLPPSGSPFEEAS